MQYRPYRSVLYIPAARARALDKARGLATDAIIFDLEDAVAPTEKAAARDVLVAELTAGGYGNRAQIVRINGYDTEWGRDDLAAVAAARPQAVLLPKVNTAIDIDHLSAQMDADDRFADTKIWAMMETPDGILNAAAIAKAPRLQGMVMGTNDLAKDLGTRYDPARLPMVAALGHCVLAARAAGIAIVDGVYNAFRDDDGLRAECNQGRDMGFDGKTLIHPAQLDITNEIFAPTAGDIDLARRQIEAFDAAVAAGEGVAVVDGKIVENLHADTARATLAKADAIAMMGAA
ncbi:MAG: CoA ester lyase [Pseudomonadota bacterium]